MVTRRVYSWSCNAKKGFLVDLISTQYNNLASGDLCLFWRYTFKRNIHRKPGAFLLEGAMNTHVIDFAFFERLAGGPGGVRKEP